MSVVDFPGGRWWKVDFHAHTPHSFDYGGLEGQDDAAADVPSLESWLLQYMDAKIDGVVIADHNSHSAIEPLREALGALRHGQHPGFRELVIFPGVEVTANDGYHLLGVFDVSAPSETVNGVLHNARYLGRRGASTATTESSLIQVASLITGAGGLAIPAHADGPRGAFLMDSRSLSELAAVGNIIAVELVGDTKLAEAEAKQWAPVLGSDAHHLDASGAEGVPDPKYPGSHFTWIKAETLNLEGLSLAISDARFSVVRSNKQVENPNQPRHTRLIAIKMTHAGEEVELPLSPWLNSIIGGRGVGKSTLLEVIRLSLQRFTELPENLMGEHQWFSPHAEPGKRFWDASTVIEIRIQKDGRDYRIRWTGASSSSPTIESLAEGVWELEPGNIAERFPILIYSQKQIYETAKDTQSLLSVIDAQPAIRHAEWLARRDQLHSQYAEARQKIAANAALIADEPRVRGEIADAKIRRQSLAELRDSGVAAELDALATAKRIHSAASASVDEFVASLNVSTARLQDSLDAAKATEPTETETALYTATENAIAQVASLRESLKASLSSVVQDTQRQAEIEELRSRVFGEADDDDADETSLEAANADFDEVSSRLEGLEAELVGIEQAAAQRSVLDEAAASILADIRTHRSDLTARRKQFIASLGLESTSLRLDLFEMGDRNGVEAELRNVLQISSSFDRFFSGADGLPLILNTPPMNPASRADIESVRRFLLAIRREGADSPQPTATGVFVEGRMHNRLAAVDPVTLETSIELWAPKDLLRVRYKPEGEEDLRALEQGSPGEKTATLLSLILRMSNDPLILDQPEDDLDNELITDLVVETLKRTKNGRQVIVVTHNANVVVNADSEQVFVLKYGAVPVVDAHGSIQNPLIRAAICKIMEGGERAFASRYRRLVGAESSGGE